MLVGVLSLVLMGVLEVVRKRDLRLHGAIDQTVAGVHYNASHVRLYWQTPQFLLAGVAESFTLVSGIYPSLIFTARRRASAVLVSIMACVRVCHKPVLYRSGCTIRAGFYRAMHYSAKCSLAIACRLSVCPSVTLVDHDHIA